MEPDTGHDTVKQTVELLVERIDVRVLRLQEGDVLVISVDPERKIDFEAMQPGFDLTSFQEQLGDAVRAALDKAGHEKVGVTATMGCQIELKIIRPDDDGIEPIETE